MRPRSAVFASALSVSFVVLPAAAQEKGGMFDKFKPTQTGTLGADGAYRLSDEEKGYDCKKLSGRMQVRLLQVRDYDTQNKPTGLSRGIQSVTSTIFGSSSAGSGLDTKHATDVAMLRAFNARLKEKKCKTFDLEAELKPKAVTETPSPR